MLSSLPSSADFSGKLLIVDDEPAIRKFLSISLSTAGYDVLEAERAQQALDLVQRHSFHIIILDLGLPDQDGQALIKKLRQLVQTPILVLSVRTDERQKVQALDSGANDYVTKPFGIAELLARIRALLRIQALERGELVEPIFQFQNLTVDYSSREVFLGDQRVKLTPKEYELLALLTRNAGKVLTHEFILLRVWGPAKVDQSQQLRVHLGHLRQKLEDDPANPKFIVTEPCVGYRFLL